MNPKHARFLAYVTVTAIFIILNMYLPDIIRNIRGLPDLSKGAYTARVHKLLGCEVCTDRERLAALGRPDAWFGLKGNEWSPDFPGIAVFLDPNPRQQTLHNIFAAFMADNHWTIVPPDTGFILGEELDSILESAEQTANGNHQDGSSIREMREMIRATAYIQEQSGQQALIFTIHRADATPPVQYQRFCFKVHDDVIIRMIATWSGQPSTPDLVDKAFHAVTIR